MTIRLTVGERLNPWDLGDVGDVPGALSLIGFSGGGGFGAPGRGSWPLAMASTPWIVEAVVVGRKREATRTRLLNELVILAVNYGCGRDARHGGRLTSYDQEVIAVFSQHLTKRCRKCGK